ncbi:unnamed protein product [Ectocarpus sp. CCAP 1310/34]|nr:unnamed protein product [Ectocarpus sp. CCAP 1310/34]
MLFKSKRYSPDQGALGQAKASEVLLVIFKSILHEFGLNPSYLASGTTDSGSDVKAVSINGLWKHFGVLWNWCFCHLMKAAEQPFCTSLDTVKSKNPAARDLLKTVIKVVETLNKSSNLGAKFEDLQVDLLGEVFKVVKHAPQRWLGLTRTLERIIRLWHPLSSITRDVQYGGAPMTAEIFMKFATLKTNVLDMSEPLRVFDIPALGEDGLPNRGEQKKALPSKMVSADQLHPTTTLAREELCRALMSRLYERVWNEQSPNPSFFCDAACLLTPPFSEGRHVSAMRLTAEDAMYLPNSSNIIAPTADFEVTAKLDWAWTEIRKRAVESVKTEQDRAGGSDAGGGGGPFKRAHTSGGRSARNPTDPDEFTDSGRTAAVEEARRMTSCSRSEVLSYWGRTGKHAFPSLKHVAQQTFGNQASAAPVERDFSGCGLFMVPNRSRVDEYWVEMVMFLKANFNSSRRINIPQIDPKDIRKCLPAKFEGTDEDHLNAEMALYPLSNDAPPAEAGLGL